MMNLDAEAVADLLPYDRLIAALAIAFAGDVVVPQREHFEVPVSNGTAGNLLLMPAWQTGNGMGVKIATVFPDNNAQGFPAVFASYILMSAETGVPVAVLDGSELTLRRTAAASALASGYLSREESRVLLIVGTGNLAPHLVAAHCVARDINKIIVWGRDPAKAVQLAETVSTVAAATVVADNLEDAVREAHVISCATLSSEPLIKGEWLQPGQHLDLVGAFRPDMREADTAAVKRASVFVDTRSGALSEAGEIVQALKENAIDKSDISGELSELAKGEVSGRGNDAEITMFKSVGTALEDLAAAELAVRNASATN